MKLSLRILAFLLLACTCLTSVFACGPAPSDESATTEEATTASPATDPLTEAPTAPETDPVTEPVTEPETEIEAETEPPFVGLTFDAATRIVIPEKEHAINVARSIASGNFLDFVELSEHIAMIKLPIPQKWVGKSMIELALRQKHGINVIAIAKDDLVRMDYPPSQPLSDGMVLFVVTDKSKTGSLFSDSDSE